MEQSGTQPDPSPEWITQAVEAWTKEGLVRREQARWILARYGLADAETAGTLKQLSFIQILTALGALLVGVGVLLLVGTQWENLPRLARLVLLAGITGAAYAGGYHLAYTRKTYIGVGKALIFLGSLFWGSSIFLVGQMYNLGDSGGDPSEYFTGLAYWFVGTLPLAYILRSQLQLALSLTLGSIWIIGRWTESLFSFPLTLVLVLSMGVFLYVVGLLHPDDPGDDAPMGPTYRKFAVAFLTVGLYAMSFSETWESLSYHGYYAWAWLAPLLTFAVLGSGWMLLSPNRQGRTRMVEAGVCLGLAIGASLLAFLVLSFSATGLAPGTSDALMILFNVLLLAAEVSFVWLGWQSMQAGLVNWGLLVFMVHLMTRYFDLFGQMLPTGLAFVGAGILVILSGIVLERQRRRLLRTMPGRVIA